MSFGCDHVDRKGRRCLRGLHFDPFHRYRELRQRSKAERRRRYALADAQDLVRERSGGLCELRFSPLCTGIADTAPHHLVLGHPRIHDAELMRDTCWACHLGSAGVHARPAAARAAGLILERSAIR